MMMPSIFFAMDDETKRDNASVKVSTDVVNSDSVNYDFLGLDYNDLIRCSDAEFEEIVCDKSTMMADHYFTNYTSRGDFQDYVRRQLAYQEEEATKSLVEEEVTCGCTKYKYKNCMHLLELVNHDCMWTGLCVNRDHRDSSSLLSRKSESRFVPSKVSPGKSVLIPKQQTMTATPVNPFAADSLSSDGDSLRPDTPLSSDSDGELDSFQGNIFKHDELCFDSLLECKSVPMSEVLSPKYFMSYSRAKWVNDKKKSEEKQQIEEDEKAQSTGESVESDSSSSSDDGRLETETAQTTCLVISKEQTWKTTLSDHCYHINKPEEPSLPMIHKKMDNLGVQTPSDSEEEIDVVSFDKPSRATATLPTYPQSSQQQQYQRMMDTALRQKTKPQQQAQQQTPAQPPRQRGRPKGSTARKRNAQAAEMSSVHVNKRTKATRPYNRKSTARVSHEHDSESDTERRSTHNNMERTRRSQLKSHFEFLRRQVPAIENNEKAAKVEILRQSRNYILALEAAFREGEEQCNMLRARQARLKNRLSVSRRELAAKGWNIGHNE